MEITFQQFLALLAGGTLSASILSLVSERFGPFQLLNPDAKKAVQLIGTVLLSIAAYAASIYIPTATITALAPWFAVVVAAYVAWKANQKTHEADPIA